MNILPSTQTHREYQQESVVKTHELDQITRKWAVMSQFEADLDRYDALKHNLDW